MNDARSESVAAPPIFGVSLSDSAAISPEEAFRDWMRPTLEALQAFTTARGAGCAAPSRSLCPGLPGDARAGGRERLPITKLLAEPDYRHPHVRRHDAPRRLRAR